MLEFLSSDNDVLALKVGGEITGVELDAVMERLDEAMGRYETVHVFVECHALDAIQLTGLGRYIRRAMPLFGKLDRFGRVAVVADQAWLRTATRVESALLPSIRYRVFRPEEREKAIGWVIGRDASKDQA